MQKLETIKVLEENIGENLLAIWLDNDFLDTSNKTKNKQVYLIKLKKFYTKKEIINKMKTQPLEWEKIKQIKQLAKDYFPIYTSSSYNSIPEKQPN